MADPVNRSGISQSLPRDSNRVPAIGGILDSTSSQVVPLEVNANGGLDVNIVGGGGSGGTASNFNAAFPGVGTAVGASNGTNMVPFLVDGSGYLEVNVKAGSGSGLSVTDEAAWTAGSSNFIPNGGAFNDSATALTSGQQGTARVTPNRANHVNIRNQAGTELATSSNPLQVSLANTATNATAVKVDGSGVTQPVSGTVTANAGTNLNTSTLATSANQTNGTQIASIQDLSANLLQVAQGSTTSGQTGPLVQGSVTTSAPTYTTAKTSPLSLDTAGNLRVNVVTGGSGGTQYTELATTTSATGTLAFGRYQTSLPTLTNGQMNEPMLDTSSRLFVNVSNATLAVTQSGTWSDTVTQTTAANLNATVVGTGTFAVQATDNITQIGGSSLSIGQQLAAASIPVILPSATITSLTQPTLQSGSTTAVTQATAASLNATVSIAAAQTLSTVTTVSAVTAITNALPAGTNGIGNVGTVSAVVNVGQKTVNTAAVQISASSTVPTNGIIIRALSTNAASIFVGGSGVTTSNGFELVAGEATSLTCNLNTLYIISAASTTDKICWNVE